MWQYTLDMGKNAENQQILGYSLKSLKWRFVTLVQRRFTQTGNFSWFLLQMSEIKKKFEKSNYFLSSKAAQH